MASEKRSADLQSAAEACHSQLDSVIVATRELESTLAEIRLRSWDIQRRKCEFEAAVSEAGNTCGEAVTELVSLLAEIKLQEQNVS